MWHVFLLMVCGPDNVREMARATLFQVYTDLKAISRSLPQFPLPETPLDNFPALAGEFKLHRPKTYEAVFGESPPRWPIPAIFESSVAFAKMIPARKSNRFVRASSSP